MNLVNCIGLLLGYGCFVQLVDEYVPKLITACNKRKTDTRKG